MRILSFAAACAAFAATTWVVIPAAAQTGLSVPPGCAATTFTDPPRTRLQCRGGLTLEVEQAADVLIPPPRAGRSIQAIELRRSGALIDIAPRRGRFQILTPHAIASVRGTIYAVDVTAGATAVFVAEGRVRVARRDGAQAVDLGPGQGVDVAPGLPLTVRVWAPERARRLLDRFAR